MDGSCAESAHHRLHAFRMPSHPTPLRIHGKRLDVPHVWKCAVAGAIVFALSSERNSCLAQTLVQTFTGPPGASMPDRFAPAGDVNQDGVPDVIAGASHPISRVFVFSGADESIIHTINAPGGAVAFGRSVAGGVDVSGDLVPDILVGAPTDALQAGHFYLYSGATFALIRQHTGVPGQNLGRPVAFLDDLDGDGTPEYAAGATHTEGLVGSFGEPPEVGEAYVYSGATGAVMFALAGSSAGDLFGGAIAQIGPVDGDGVPDFAVGEWLLTTAGKGSCGAVWLYSGKTGQLIRKDEGPASNSRYGRSIVPLGDVDADGRHDYATSCWMGTNGVHVVSGVDGSVLTSIQAPPLTQLALEVGSVDDLDGDGRRDVVMANRSLLCECEGHVAVVGSLNGLELMRIDDPVEVGNDNFAHSAKSLGDLDGDGREEIGEADLFDDPSGGGSIYVFSTRPLYALASDISASQGGSIPLELNGGIAHAGAPYLLLASVTPLGPTTCGDSGIAVGPVPVYIPMCSDLVMHASIVMANTKPFVNTRGTLDAATGKGLATFDLTGISLPPSAVGFSFYFAYLAKGPAGGPWDLASNAESVLIVP